MSEAIRSSRPPSAGWAVAVALFVFGGLTLATGTFRLVLIANPDLAPAADVAEANARYVAHPVLSLLHIVPGMVFLVLAPLQLVGAIRRRWPGFHRWTGRVAVSAALISALSTFALAPLLPALGGAPVIVASFLYAGWMAVALLLGWRAIRARDMARHRRWMIRAFAAGIGVSMVRVWLIVLSGTGLSTNAQFGVSFWAGFGVTVLLGEAVLARGRARRQASPPATQARNF